MTAAPRLLPGFAPSPFSSAALQHHAALVQDAARVHASCEDDPAGAGIDRQLVAADVGAGRRIGGPTCLAWGSDDPGKRGLTPREIWGGWGSDLSGAEIASGHFGATVALLPFAAQGGGR